MDLVLFHDLSNILLIAGIAILIIEAVILGFSTFVLLFLGLSLVLTGVGMKAGILDATYVTALWSNSLVTSVLAFTLWKPLRNMQSKVEVQDIDNDNKNELILGGLDGLLRVFKCNSSYELEIFWEHPFGASISGFLVSDINNDNLNEIIAYYIDKLLRVLNPLYGYLICG